jgi:hypothetical protein
MITRRVLRVVIWLIVWAAAIALFLLFVTHIGSGGQPVVP